MQILKTTRVSNYNLDFMVICLAENIIKGALARNSRMRIALISVREILKKLASFFQDWRVSVF